MTITSGLAQVGKTHLAVNLALELVRRGRLVAVFQDYGQLAAVDELLELQQPVLLPRRADDNDEHGIIRRGYQGVDILSCELPLKEWPDIDAGQRLHCMRHIDVQDGYDDFLIDTSGMDVRSLLACCKASAVVILTVTPEPGSQAEAFALLRVLRLNGFSGELCLVVNKSLYSVDSLEIYSEFSRLIAAHLELELSFLGAVPEDPHVTLAQRNRQAFSSLFPDSEAAAGVVVVADALDAIPAHFVAGPQTLPTFLDALVTVLQAPVRLPGGGVLEDAHASVARTEGVDELIAADGEQGGETSLLQYAGDVAGLWLSLETLPHTLQSLAGNLEALVAVAGRNSTRMPDDDMGELQGNQLLPLLARLLETFRVAAPEQALELEVTGVSVTGQQQCWLQAGHYLKYTFRLPQGALTDTVAALLDEVPAMSRTSGAEGEDICEVLAAAQNSCLSVISSPQAGPRIQVWLPVTRNESLAGVAGRRQGEGITTLGKGLH